MQPNKSTNKNKKAATEKTKFQVLGYLRSNTETPLLIYHIFPQDSSNIAKKKKKEKKAFQNYKTELALNSFKSLKSHFRALFCSHIVKGKKVIRVFYASILLL